MTVGSLSFESLIALLIAAASAVAKLFGVTVARLTETATLPTPSTVGVASGSVSMTWKPTEFPKPSDKNIVLPAARPVRSDCTRTSLFPD